jgi:hypothetical protein
VIIRGSYSKPAPKAFAEPVSDGAEEETMTKLPVRGSAPGILATAILTCVAICAAAPSAFADPPKSAKDYAYDFPDDKLLGVDGQGTVPMIKVRPPGKREMLHRPRLHFVAELLKSVENM